MYSGVGMIMKTFYKKAVPKVKIFIGHNGVFIFIYTV